MKDRYSEDRVRRVRKVCVTCGRTVTLSSETLPVCLGNDSLHTALCGVSNKRTRRNFEWVAEWIKKRPEPPLLIASTLPVPGYIDEEEVREISRWVASLNRDIPYTLLAFYPQFFFKDLPVTPRGLAIRCKEVAEREGLRRVRIGNLHLL